MLGVQVFVCEVNTLEVLRILQDKIQMLICEGLRFMMCAQIEHSR
jgi:hypothetical protein